MDAGQMALLIPIVAICVPISAIVCACGIGFFKSWSSHQQEMARIRANKTVTVDNAGLEALRNEVMRLRDTTTQYDMSVESTLSDLRNRVDHIESRMEITPVSPAKPVVPPAPPRGAAAAYNRPERTESETQSVTPGAS